MTTVTGDKALDRKLRRLRQSVQTRLMKSAASAGLRVQAKEIKALIPSQWKSARKGIGSSLKKNRKKHKLEAKVGVKVGKKQAKLIEWGMKEAAKRKAEGKRGVGVSPMTLHWFVTGNYHITSPPMRGLAQRGASKSAGKAKAAISQKLRAGIMREAKKQ